MIRVTRLNGVSFLLNAELIEQVESTPDTLITLTTGNNILVRETVDDIGNLVIAYRASIANDKSAQRASARPRE